MARSVASQVSDLYCQGDEQLKQEYALMVKLGLPVMFFNTPRDAQTVRHNLSLRIHVLDLPCVIRLS